MVPPIPELRNTLQAAPKQVELARKLTKVLGPWETRRYFVHNNVVKNLGRGLAERVFYVVKEGALHKPPLPVEFIFDKLEWYSRKVSRCFGERITPIDRSDFPKLYKEARKRTIYEKAVESLELEGWTPKHGRVTTFIKAEKIDATTKADPAPRVIQPRKPEYNVELGVYLKPTEHKIYNSVARALQKSTVIAKGLNTLQLGNLLLEKWEGFSCPAAIGLDASRFDQHVSLEALQWEHAIYTRLTEPRCRPKLNKLLKYQLLNKGVALAKDGGFRYEVEGCRMSGDMNTALGNCLLMTAMTAQLCLELNIKYDFINNGDDLVLFVDRDEVPRVMEKIPNFYKEYGFTMKVEDPVYIFEELEFCQMHPVCTPHGVVMTRNFDVVLNKDLHTLLDIPNEKRFKQWMTAIAKCGLAGASGIPILQPFYEALNFDVHVGKLMSHGAFDRGSSHWYEGMEVKSQPIAPETRVSFALAFGVSAREQDSIEALIASWRPEYSTPVVPIGFLPRC